MRHTEHDMVGYIRDPKIPRAMAPRRLNFVQVFSVMNLLLVTLQTHRALGWLPDFWKISGSTLYMLWYLLSSLITRFVELITDYHLVKASYNFWTISTTHQINIKQKCSFLLVHNLVDTKLALKSLGNIESASTSSLTLETLHLVHTLY
jgi:hypothetical protein